MGKYNSQQVVRCAFHGILFPESGPGTGEDFGVEAWKKNADAGRDPHPVQTFSQRPPATKG